MKSQGSDELGLAEQRKSTWLSQVRSEHQEEPADQQWSRASSAVSPRVFLVECNKNSDRLCKPWRDIYRRCSWYNMQHWRRHGRRRYPISPIVPRAKQQLFFLVPDRILYLLRQWLAPSENPNVRRSIRRFKNINFGLISNEKMIGLLVSGRFRML